MNNEITKEKVKRYRNITKSALEEAKKAIAKNKEKAAREILEMVSNYLSDSEYFEEKEDLIDSFAAINYAHGWLDCGARLKIFKVKNNKLFTV
ncbi:MAG: DUF357 domain-containing protein [Candidatus Pacearchaeota archaeon]|nr:DUF357 domain-containing protein [Candidatus Pacearchaeota archaeon]